MSRFYDNPHSGDSVRFISNAADKDRDHKNEGILIGVRKPESIIGLDESANQCLELALSDMSITVLST